MLFKKIFRRLLLVVQIFLIGIFIVFEELIWEGIAQPIYTRLRELNILQTLEHKLKNLNRYLLLVLFLALFVSVEGAGIVAGVMAVRGLVITAAMLYVLKIPIAAFVFWLFRVTEDRLLSFGWFRWSYEKITTAFAWIKSREIYQETLELAHRTKEALKRFKERYFSGDNTISRRIRRLYRIIKRS